MAIKNGWIKYLQKECECVWVYPRIHSKKRGTSSHRNGKKFFLKMIRLTLKNEFFFGWGWQSKKKKTIQQAVHKMFQSHCRRKSHSGFDLISPNWESKTDKTDSDKGKKLKKKWQWKFPNQILPLREWNGITKYFQTTTITRSLGRSSH